MNQSEAFAITPFRRGSWLAGFACLFPVPLLLIAFDMAIDKKVSYLHWTAKQWGIWATGLVWDFSAWACLIVVLLALLRSSRPSLRLIGHVLLWSSAIGHSLAIAISAGYHAVFHQLPNIHALEFAINEWENAWAMFTDALTAWTALWFLVSIPGLAWLQYLSVRR